MTPIDLPMLLSRCGVWRAEIIETPFGEDQQLILIVPKTAVRRATDLICRVAPAYIKWSVQEMENPLRLKKFTYLLNRLGEAPIHEVTIKGTVCFE